MQVTVVKIYLTEAEHKLKPIMDLLCNTLKVRGATVYRGIEGFGKSGHMYKSSLVDLSVDLPLVIEFFDSPEIVETIIPQLSKIVDKDHILCFSAVSANGA